MSRTRAVFASVCRSWFRRLGFTWDTAADGAEGLARAGAATYEAVILDVMLPRMDGLSVLRTLRARGNDVHVLVLMARDVVADRVAGLSTGADDYLMKPFAFDELVARLQPLRRRKHGVKSPIIRSGSLEVETVARRVSVEGQPVVLTPQEMIPVIRHLNHLLSRLEQSVEGERLFSANISDKLRTPICEARNALEMASLWPEDREVHRHAVALATGAVASMETIVTTMLLFACSRRGERAHDGSVFDAAAVLDEVLASLQPINAERRLQVPVTTAAHGGLRGLDLAAIVGERRAEHRPERCRASSRGKSRGVLAAARGRRRGPVR